MFDLKTGRNFTLGAWHSWHLDNWLERIAGIQLGGILNNKRSITLRLGSVFHFAVVYQDDGQRHWLDLKIL